MTDVTSLADKMAAAGGRLLLALLIMFRPAEIYLSAIALAILLLAFHHFRDRFLARPAG